MVLWIIGLLLAASLVCGNAAGGTPSGESSRSASETASPEGVAWVLETLDGEPVLEGTFVWLRLDGGSLEGLDGCNTYGGRNEDGTPAAGADGQFNVPPYGGTEMLCLDPDGIMEQADRYLQLLGRGQSFRVVDDRLEILDGAGEALLGFVRQVPLAGKPVELASTEWQQVVDGSAGEDVRAATLVFLDDRHAVGITACRGYAAFYLALDGRLRFPTISMTEYDAPCVEESRRQEGQFTDDLSQAIEYSVSDEDGTRRLRIRTSRGRTVTFEPLAGGVQSVFDVGWPLTAFVTVSKGGDPDAPLLRVDRLIPQTVVTARFHEKGVSGFGGCNFYGARLEPEEPIAREDGSFAKGALTLESTVMYCSDPPGVTEQEERFTELIPQFERYRIYGQLLVVHTKGDVVLLFQYE